MTRLGTATAHLAARALGSLRGGALELRGPGGRRQRFGDGEGSAVVIELHRPEAFWDRLARRTRVGFGESYVDGDWDCEDLVGLFSLLGRNLDVASEARTLRAVHRLQALRPDRSQRQTVAAARDNIHAHYDLGNDFFTLMLDPTMAYSCAYWEREEMTLEEAQTAKFRRLCEKLRLGPDDHLLEIGCGWGGFAIHVAREHGCRVTAITISPGQARLARERVATAGLAALVAIVERDYRLVEGTFTRIASIEMLEAIGYAEFATYFGALDRLLAPSGIAAIQVIGMPDARFERYRRTPDWIQQYIFPGSLLPSVELIARTVARTRLMITGLEEIGIGYARTLREWRLNVDRRADEVRALGYDERFLRIWRFYLTYCEAAFAIRALRDVQLVFTRPGNDALPTYPEPRISF